jgi:flagellar biosynthetic protein FliR
MFNLDALFNLAGVYLLVLFRVAGMMVFAPLMGSARVPRRVKGLLAITLAAALAPTVTPPAQLPTTIWGLAIGIGGEIMFGLAMGMILSMIFVAAQWAGEIIGQQMGLNLGETFDPQFGSHGSMIGDVYYFLTLMIFMAIDGDRAMIRGVHDSFGALPLLSGGINQSIFGVIIGLFAGATKLAMQLAAPVLVTMLVVDLVLGFIGKTVPQLNIMTAGIALRSLIGTVVIIVGMGLTSTAIRDALLGAMRSMISNYTMR